jgi:hypothetical protein
MITVIDNFLGELFYNAALKIVYVIFYNECK